MLWMSRFPGKLLELGSEGWMLGGGERVPYSESNQRMQNYKIRVSGEQ